MLGQREDLGAGIERLKARRGDFVSLLDHMVGEEVNVSDALVELLRCQNAREQRHANIELHPHEAADHCIGHELMAVDTSVDHEACGNDRIELARLRKATSMKRKFERTRNLEQLDARLVANFVQESGSRIVHDVAMPT